jgi:hypothetical protein
VTEAEVSTYECPQCGQQAPLVPDKRIEVAVIVKCQNCQRSSIAPWGPPPVEKPMPARRELLP